MAPVKERFGKLVRIPSNAYSLVPVSAAGASIIYGRPPVGDMQLPRGPWAKDAYVAWSILLFDIIYLFELKTTILKIIIRKTRIMHKNFYLKSLI